MLRGSHLTAALIAGMLLASCGARSVRIAQIKDDPGRYDDKAVSVTGVVTSSWGIPLVPFQFYNLDDGSGEITVLAQSSRVVPSKGARVHVKGRLSQLGTIGGRSIGLHIEERDRDRR
jgi:hypothetical protein